MPKNKSNQIIYIKYLYQKFNYYQSASKMGRNPHFPQFDHTDQSNQHESPLASKTKQKWQKIDKKIFQITLAGLRKIIPFLLLAKE